ncbi:MAG: FMN-binding protein, partial [Bacillota bacterium]|nr:FMN-binding protein [Bacillota bacterium]
VEQRIFDETIAELRQLFPDLEDFEEKEVDGRSGIVATDASGNVVGVLAEGRTEGYAGTIRFNLGVNAAGEIVGLSIIQHSETAGLGSKITEEAFRNQFIGLSAGDDFDVDNISGATVSTRAMESGVEKELGEIMVRFMGAEAPAAPSLSLSDVADGTYTGTASGFNADITVEVTVADGKITAITVVEQDDTPDRFASAEEQVISQILENQTVQVDAASGATVSSEGIMNAVLNALSQ